MVDTALRQAFEDPNGLSNFMKSTKDMRPVKRAKQGKKKENSFFHGGPNSNESQQG